jgi:hypothetical protein
MSQEEIQQMLGNLSASVQAFHDRFELKGSATREELLSRIPIQEEEVRELHAAILLESPERVASEALDILYVAIGTVLRLDPGIVAVALDEIIRKNNSKTLFTHHINAAGKVVRRS